MGVNLLLPICIIQLLQVTETRFKNNLSQKVFVEKIFGQVGQGFIELRDKVGTKETLWPRSNKHTIAPWLEQDVISELHYLHLFLHSNFKALGEGI